MSRLRDELIFTSDLYEHEDRLRSYELWASHEGLMFARPLNELWRGSLPAGLRSDPKNRACSQSSGSKLLATEVIWTYRL